MPEYVPLSKSTHRESAVVVAGYDYALKQAVVPVVAEELPNVLPTLVTGFVRSEKGNSFELVALQSLQAGTNVYVHTNGRWIGGYRPAWYRAHPFRLLKDRQSGRYVVCVDEASPAFEEQASEQATRLFDDEGELTPGAQDAVAFLEKLQKATRVTQALVGQLEKAGIIVPWSPAKLPEGQSASVKLYHIDEPALKQLDPATLSRLAASGALSMAYTQLLSEHRLQGLARLHRLRDQASASAGDTAPDLDAMFGEDDDLTFDFD